MSKFVIQLLVFVSVVTMLVSCDDHEPIDLDIHTGYILCAGGKIMSTEDYFDQTEEQAVGVVFAGETADHGVLSVLLQEIEPIQFCDSLGIELGTSCDVTAYDGYLNTTAMQNSHDDKTGKGSPLADRVFRYHHDLQSDYIPSVAEMSLLFLVKDQVNAVIERCGGTPLYTDMEDGRCWYWTSTEVEQNKGNQAWLFSMSDGSRHETPKTNSYRARAIVEHHSINN